MERIDQQFEFLREIDKEKFIGRQTYLTDGKRKENDAEHAWHMAIMTILLGEYANEEIDVLKTVTMLLIHDIVEKDPAGAGREGGREDIRPPAKRPVQEDEKPVGRIRSLRDQGG